MDEQPKEQDKETPPAAARPQYPYAIPPPAQQGGMSRNALIFVIILVAIAIIFSLIFAGAFGLYGGPGG